MTKDERYGTDKEQDNQPGAAKPAATAGTATGTAGAGAAAAARPPAPKAPGLQPPGLHPKPPFGMPVMPVMPRTPPVAAKPAAGKEPDKDPQDKK